MTTARKHNHYFKDVTHLASVDVYRVLQLFGVTDQALGHAIKKLLVAGGRGAKDMPRDVQEAIDTLNRWQEMQSEDKNVVMEQKTATQKGLGGLGDNVQLIQDIHLALISNPNFIVFDEFNRVVDGATGPTAGGYCFLRYTSERTEEFVSRIVRTLAGRNRPAIQGNNPSKVLTDKLELPLAIATGRSLDALDEERGVQLVIGETDANYRLRIVFLRLGAPFAKGEVVRDIRTNEFARILTGIPTCTDLYEVEFAQGVGFNRRFVEAKMLTRDLTKRANHIPDSATGRDAGQP